MSNTKTTPSAEIRRPSMLRQMQTSVDMSKEAAQAKGLVYKGGEGVELMNRAKYGYWHESFTSVDGRPRMPWLTFLLYVLWVIGVHALAMCVRRLDGVLITTLDAETEAEFVFALNPWVIGVIGTALFFLLVFRTNLSYQRWWEGRIIWGMVTFTSRDLARQATSYIRERERAQRFVKLVIAFPVVLKRHLRGEKELVELADVLTPEERKAIIEAQHMVVFILELIALELAAALRAGCIGEFTAMSLDRNLSTLEETLGRCERILTTKMPFAYVVQLRTLLSLWLLVLPFVTPGFVGWGGVLVCVLIAYLLIGIETISIEIEQPFGHEFNDLPLDKYSDKIIKPNLLAILERYTGEKGGLKDGGKASGIGGMFAVRRTPAATSAGNEEAASTPSDS